MMRKPRPSYRHRRNWSHLNFEFRWAIYQAIRAFWVLLFIVFIMAGFIVSNEGSQPRGSIITEWSPWP